MRALTGIGAQARWRARNAGLAIAAGALMSVGAGFLLSALWVVLARELGPLATSVIFGVMFLVAGVFVLLLRRPPPPVAASPPLVDAFILGISAWMAIRDRRRR